MKLYIPRLGDRLILSADWTFKLYDEHRNDALFKALKIPFPVDGDGRRQCYGRHQLSVTVTLPAGTELAARRIYIRQGQRAFDSVTFSAKIGGKFRRFWAKLDEVNGIEFAVHAAEEPVVS